MFILAIGGVVLLIRWRTVPIIGWISYHGSELVLIYWSHRCNKSILFYYSIHHI